MTPIPVVFTPAHRGHDPPYEINAGEITSPVHERPARAEAIRAALEDAGHTVVGARGHAEQSLMAVHDPGLVRFLREGHDRWRGAGGPPVMIPDTFASPKWAGGGRRPTSALGEPGWWCFDTATPIVDGSYAASRAAVDGALTGVDLLREGAAGAYALCRPPGHHAGRDYYGGFCLFNNAAVAARDLGDDGRVAILDVDYHHGNGTQDVFWDDPTVLYVSLHGDPAHAFPFFSGFADEVGGGRGRGTNRNLPLAAGTDDGRYLDTLDVALDVVDRFAPASLVVSLGFDALAEDPIAACALSSQAYRQIGERIGQLGLATLFVQEGGYALEALGDAAARTLAGFAASR